MCLLNVYFLCNLATECKKDGCKKRSAYILTTFRLLPEVTHSQKLGGGGPLSGQKYNSYSLGQQHFNVIVALISFANFNANQCNQTNVHVDKVVIRQEQPFSLLCERLCPWTKTEHYEWVIP